MLSEVVVHEPGEYEAWVNKTEDLPPVELGEKLYAMQGCKACHSVDGSASIGPSWKGSWGKERKLENGSSVLFDENYVRESVNNPTAKVAAGFVPSMPTYQGKLSDKDINGIVEYIKSLK
jgi:cytochrome c oxidase subunit 2